MTYGRRRNFKVRYEFGGKIRTRRVYSSTFGGRGWGNCDCIYDMELNQANKGAHHVDDDHDSRVCVGLMDELGLNHSLIDEDGNVYWSIQDGIARWYENGVLVAEEDRRVA
jgi:hypothetical protein